MPYTIGHFRRPPALSRDAAYPASIRARHQLEKIVVYNLILFMRSQGFWLAGVWDGEVMERPVTVKAALEMVFNLDQASLRFRKQGYKEHGVLIVLGNDGWDAISDWSYGEGDPDGFNLLMESYSNAVMEKWG